MKTLYIDCSMGAAGDMLTGALIELTDDSVKTIEELNALGIPDVTFSLERTEKCGIYGTHIHVLVNGEEEGEHSHEHHHDHHDHHHDHEHHHDHHHEHGHHHHTHTGMHGIEHIVWDHLNVSDSVKQNIIDVYRLIAEAESTVHGMPIDQIHFHEVGTKDAVADVTAVCYLMDQLGFDRVLASPVHVGRGTVACAHGILPVPAPATALILKDVPIYSRDEIEGELCTPTGAALLKHFVTKFESMPVMNVSNIGYGMGTKDFPIANCVRLLAGETTDAKDLTYDLSFNIDDMTAEDIGYAMDVLLNNGARDVFTIPVGMKKNRPGTFMSVICTEETKEALVRLIFKHTTTIGIRETAHQRYILERTIAIEDTEFGPIRRKDSFGYGVRKSKYEYDDLVKAARDNDCSIEDIRRKLIK